MHLHSCKVTQMGLEYLEVKNHWDIDKNIYFPKPVLKLQWMEA